MPALADLVARVLSLATTPAVIGILVTAGSLVVTQDWRMYVTALAAQYFLLVVLLTRLIRLEMAAVKGLIGWLICLVFYLTERQASSLDSSSSDDSPSPLSRHPTALLGQLHDQPQGQRPWLTGARASFNLLTTILVSTAAYAAARRFPLPEVSTDITLASYLLAGLGMLLVGLGEAPMRIGLGLLTFLSGFDLFYVALEPSLLVAGLLSVLNLVIALATAYLRTARIAALSERETT